MMRPLWHAHGSLLVSMWHARKCLCAAPACDLLPATIAFCKRGSYVATTRAVLHTAASEGVLHFYGPSTLTCNSQLNSRRSLLPKTLKITRPNA
jgi:hypothetical protein